MSLPRFAVKQVVLMNLLFFVFIVAGLLILTRLPVDVYPDTSLDIATIQTLWVGSSSEEVERLITRKIEDEIEDTRGTDRIISVSQPDVSVITVKFREDLTPEQYEAAFGDLRGRLDRVVDLPEGAEEPVLERLTTDEVLPLLQVGVVNTGNVDETVLRRVALDLKDELRFLPGVAWVKLIGLREREIHISIDKVKIQKHNLSIKQVADTITASNLNLPAGYVESGDAEITLRSVGEVEDPQKFGEICIVRSDSGAHVRLREVATIEESFERAFWGAHVNGKPAIIVQVCKEHGENSITVRDAVKKCLATYNTELDIDGVEVEIQSDSTTIIESRLGVLRSNLGVGLLLIFLVLWIAIGARNSILAIVGIPFSFLCAVIFMHTIGVSLNAVSVFSLVLVSGMIVDDAIVVLENIYHHIQNGMPRREAVIFGTEEVIWPVISSSMTTIAAFLPLLIMTGVLGKFFAIVPKTVTVALVASLFECLVILPVHYLDFGPRARKGVLEKPLKDLTAGDGWRQRLTRIYDVSLRQILAYRYMGLLVLAACGVFVWQAQRTLVWDLFPSDFPTFAVTINSRPGSSLETTTEEVAALAEVVDSFKPDRVSRSSAAIGLQMNEDNQRIMRTDVAQMWVDIATGDGVVNDPVKVMNDVRTALNEYLAAHPESRVEFIKAWPLRDGPPVGKPVAIRVEHPDYDEARVVVERIKERLESMPGVFDVADNLQLGNRELVLKVDDARASELGLTFTDVATAFRGAVDGLFVGVYKDTQHDEDLDIKVRYYRDQVSDVDQLPEIDLVSRTTGQVVKLHEVAKLDFDQTYTNRYHYDTKRAVEITADVDNNHVDAKMVNEAILKEFGPLAEGDDKLAIFAGGQFEETQDSFVSLVFSAIIAVSVIYVILSTQFRSYSQPLVVLTAIVFGIMGMFLGLVVNDYPFSVVTGIAMVGLCGVVVNDAIVLLDFINQERLQGMSVMEAVRQGSHRRMRPILLTTITTIVGLAPMAFGVGGYSKIWSPFAMSMCWGLVFSTVLTLLIVPALYCILEDARKYFLGTTKVYGQDVLEVSSAASDDR